MNAHEQLAVALGYGFLLIGSGFLVWYAAWIYRGIKSVPPNERKEKRRG